MKKFKFINKTKNKKIRVMHNNFKSDLYVLFLHGFKSDLEGKKPRSILNYCKRKKINFLALEYSGHGKSYGKFEKGNISVWTDDIRFVVKKFIKNKKFIIVGSSMGTWLGLNIFKIFKNQINGFIGIGSAPEFLERLMWNKFSKKIKKEIVQKGIYHLKHGNYQYPITYQLIKDGRKNKVLKRKYKSKIPVTMIHGKKDEVVPVNYSKKVLSLFQKAKKKLLIIKNGDHSLSNKKNIKKIIFELDKILINVI